MSRGRRTPRAGEDDPRLLEGNRTATLKLVDRSGHQLIRFERYITAERDAQYDEPLWRSDSIPATVTVEIEGEPVFAWHFACKACRDRGTVWEISVPYQAIKDALGDLLGESRRRDAPMARSLRV